MLYSSQDVGYKAGDFSILCFLHWEQKKLSIDVGKKTRNEKIHSNRDWTWICNNLLTIDVKLFKSSENLNSSIFIGLVAIKIVMLHNEFCKNSSKNKSGCNIQAFHLWDNKADIQPRDQRIGSALSSKIKPSLIFQYCLIMWIKIRINLPLMHKLQLYDMIFDHFVLYFIILPLNTYIRIYMFILFELLGITSMFYPFEKCFTHA